MTNELRPLINDGWGVDSCCFVCEASNEAGLRIPFHHDVDAGEVVAPFALDERFSGAPRYVHGGVLLAVLDEAMAWATIAVAGSFVVTKDTRSRFERPVRVGEDHRVQAHIEETTGDIIRVSAEIVRADGRRCVTADATFVVLDAGHAADAAGEDLDENLAGYIADS